MHKLWDVHTFSDMKRCGTLFLIWVTFVLRLLLLCTDILCTLFGIGVPLFFTLFLFIRLEDNVMETLNAQSNLKKGSQSTLQTIEKMKIQIREKVNVADLRATSG